MKRRPRRNWMRCDVRSSEGDRLAMMNGFDAPLDGWDWTEQYGRVADRRLKKVPDTFLHGGGWL